jgi:DNA polymerase-1
MFKALPEHLLMQIDLSQAESRYVAFDGPDATLMKLLADRKDIHTYVAARIFNKPEELIGKDSQERQLGKKSGHAANYGVGPRTFAESCLVENNLVITEQEARRIINAYYSVFPGIRRRQQNIQNEIRRTKKLVTPIGFERYFYNRISDACFREAYAFAPQSTIPAIMNHLMLFLYREFPTLKFCAQGHDSCLMQVPLDIITEVSEAAMQYDSWHPKISLPGGNLIIPIDIEVGEHWFPMRKV